MGLNEEIDLDIYNEATPIISNMERLKVEDNGVFNTVTISMVLNSFIGKDNSEKITGDIAKIKVVTDWRPRKVAVKTRGPRSRNADEFLSYIVSIESDIQIPKEYERAIKDIFGLGINSQRLISGIYYPYIKHLEKNQKNEEVEKARKIRDEDEKKLWSLINDFDEINQSKKQKDSQLNKQYNPPKPHHRPKIQPKKQEDNQPKKETPKGVFGNMWTSTSTWDIKK